MKDVKRAISDCCWALVYDNGVRQATKYLSPKLVVKATAQTFKGKRLKGNETLVVTIGRPNYDGREFIKKCKKAGEALPKKIQLKFVKGIK